MKTKSIKTNSREEIIDISNEVKSFLNESKVSNGLLTVFIPHTTAGVTINENADPDVKTDIIKGLKSLSFEQLNFDHFEGNSPAHLKASLMGSSVNIVVNNGELVLGTWQGIMFCEFDGPRNRKFIISITGE